MSLILEAIIITIDFIFPRGNLFRVVIIWVVVVIIGILMVISIVRDDSKIDMTHYQKVETIEKDELDISVEQAMDTSISEEESNNTSKTKTKKTKKSKLFPPNE